MGLLETLASATQSAISTLRGYVPESLKQYPSASSEPTTISTGGGGTSQNVGGGTPSLLESASGAISSGISAISSKPVETTTQVITTIEATNPVTSVLVAPTVLAAKSLENLISPIAEKSKLTTIRSGKSEVESNKYYAMEYSIPSSKKAGAEFSSTQVVKGIALASPNLLPETERFMTGKGSIYTADTGNVWEKEGGYAYLGAAQVSQHGKTDIGWLYKSSEGAHFLAKPSKEIIGLGSLGQEVSMSGGPAAWSGMTESGRLSIEPLFPALPQGSKVTAVKDISTGEFLNFTGLNAPSTKSEVQATGAISATTEKQNTNVSEVIRPSELQNMLQPRGYDQGLESAIKTFVTRFGESSSTVPIVGDLMKLGSQGVFGKDIFTATREITTIGEPVIGKAVTEYGTPYQEIKDLGGGSYSITTYTPSKTTQEISTPVTTTVVPLSNEWQSLEKTFTGKVSSKILPEWEYSGSSEGVGAGLAIASGAYTGLREKPLTALTYLAGGVILAAGGEAVAGLAGATTVGTAGTSLYPIAVGTEFLATKAFPVVLTGLYGMDIAMTGLKPSTKSGSILDTEWTFRPTTTSLSEMGGRISTELVPMTIGGLGYAYRGKIADEYATFRKSGGIEGAYFKGLSGIEEKVWGFRQKVAGFERIPYGTTKLEYYTEGEPLKYDVKSPLKSTTKIFEFPSPDTSRYAFTMDFKTDVPAYVESQNLPALRIKNLPATIMTKQLSEIYSPPVYHVITERGISQAGDFIIVGGSETGILSSFGYKSAYGTKALATLLPEEAVYNRALAAQGIEKTESYFYIKSGKLFGREVTTSESPQKVEGSIISTSFRDLETGFTSTIEKASGNQLMREQVFIRDLSYPIVKEIGVGKEEPKLFRGKDLMIGSTELGRYVTQGAEIRDIGGYADIMRTREGKGTIKTGIAQRTITKGGIIEKETEISYLTDEFEKAAENFIESPSSLIGAKYRALKQYTISPAEKSDILPQWLFRQKAKPEITQVRGPRKKAVYDVSKLLGDMEKPSTKKAPSPIDSELSRGSPMAPLIMESKPSSEMGAQRIRYRPAPQKEFAAPGMMGTVATVKSAAISKDIAYKIPFRENAIARESIFKPTIMSDKQYSPTRADLLAYMSGTRNYAELNNYLRQVGLYNKWDINRLERTSSERLSTNFNMGRQSKKYGSESIRDLMSKSRSISSQERETISERSREIARIPIVGVKTKTSERTITGIIVTPKVTTKTDTITTEKITEIVTPKITTIIAPKISGLMSGTGSEPRGGRTRSPFREIIPVDFRLIGGIRKTRKRKGR